MTTVDIYIGQLYDDRLTMSLMCLTVIDEDGGAMEVVVEDAVCVHLSEQGNRTSFP